MLRVAFGWASKVVFFGGQDCGPSIIEQVLVSLKLLLLLFQAPCHSYQPALEALLLERILRHDEVFVAKDCLLLGGWTVTIVLRVIFYGLFIGAGLPVFLFLLFGSCSNRVFIVFGVVRSTIFSGASVAII